ncbi:SMP-30/gluconolactonase/LRE family protein [Nocardia sp. NPDC051570]|uniref:SMP-30/gluconolactonase/LRE family protein n=1 Tax=Nocardia sp. NPDC051570 TaxID=3364324 RepID=UPI0037B37A7B
MTPAGSRGPLRCVGRMGAAALSAAAATLSIGVATAAPASSCGPATVTTEVAAHIPLLDWSENLTVDRDGDLWVSRPFRSVVERYNHEGRRTASVGIPTPDSVRLGPDGLLYVNYINATSGALPPGGGVARFDPAAPQPHLESFASGLRFPNGSAFDTAGNLYVADTLFGVVRIRPDGTTDRDWTDRAPKTLGPNGFNTNGIVASGDSLYVTYTISPAARVIRIPLADPAHPTVAADLAAAPLTLPAFPDDLALGPGGLLYVATASGGLVRVDPATRSTCTVLSGPPITSVAVVPGSDRALYLGSEGGDVLRVHLN